MDWVAAEVGLPQLIEDAGEFSGNHDSGNCLGVWAATGAQMEAEAPKIAVRTDWSEDLEGTPGE